MVYSEIFHQFFLFRQAKGVDGHVDVDPHGLKILNQSFQMIFVILRKAEKRFIHHIFLYVFLQSNGAVHWLWPFVALPDLVETDFYLVVRLRCRSKHRHPHNLPVIQAGTFQFPDDFAHIGAVGTYQHLFPILRAAVIGTQAAADVKPLHIHDQAVKKEKQGIKRAGERFLRISQIKHHGYCHCHEQVDQHDILQFIPRSPLSDLLFRLVKQDDQEIRRQQQAASE